MQHQNNMLARALLLAVAVMPTLVAAQDKTMAPVKVTASPLGTDETTQILSPAKVLTGDELRDKLGSSLGETLSQELGVSSSGFGAGASRPIIRGLEGSRIKILQNGMAVSDVSSLSNDHAVGSSVIGARQIEILRGPAALAYGSGAIGGLVNIVNDRIPETLPNRPSGEIAFRRGSVDNGNALSFGVDGRSGNIGLHADGSLLEADNYRIPSGTLASSFNREQNGGFGLSTIGNWGHAGLSFGALNKRYGIPTAEKSQIDLTQNRLDFDSLIKAPWQGFDSLRFKLANTDYQHTELSSALIPQTNFTNQSLETRIELTHLAMAGWRGKFGLQNEQSRFAALAADGSSETVPATRSRSLAGFVVEEKDFGALRINTGVRFETVSRDPNNQTGRSFGLTSWSGGGLWRFSSNYGLGATYSIAQRAPTTEELYSNGPHEATATYDIGASNLRKETSHNIELSLQKVEGQLRWKGNLFQNKVRNFIYGQYGSSVDEDGVLCGGVCAESFTQRDWMQANATLYGGEAEVSYNLHGTGLSVRSFADTTRGRLDNGDNLPLQPAARIGISAAYLQGPWRSNASLIRTAAHERIASTETTTPGNTRFDISLAYTQRYGRFDLTWFLIGKNLLNQDIRMSTSVLKDQAPAPGRNIIIGMSSRF
jgi:iron complex outermembrane receptor protein